MILTAKYRIKDKRARKALIAYARNVNYVWNYCSGYQRKMESYYRAGAPKRKWPTHFDLTKLTAGTSKELGLNSGTIGEVCRIFAQSRNAKHRAPKFRKSLGAGRSLGWVPFRDGCVRIDGNSITYLGKAFRVFGSRTRPIPIKIRTGGFVEDARGRWYVYLTYDAQDLAPSEAGVIGIDLGLKTLATLSTGEAIPALHHFRRYQRLLAIAQRAGNDRRVKAIHALIRNARRDQIHKATTKIARENKFIAIGNINIPKLAKTRMAKSVLDASWGLFRAQLEYKASRHQAEFIVVDERNTSRSCSNCGAIRGPEGIAGLGIREWECADCGAFHNRDVNAAKNILRLGQSMMARADGSRSALS